MKTIWANQCIAILMFCSVSFCQSDDITVKIFHSNDPLALATKAHFPAAKISMLKEYNMQPNKEEASPSNTLLQDDHNVPGLQIVYLHDLLVVEFWKKGIQISAKEADLRQLTLNVEKANYAVQTTTRYMELHGYPVDLSQLAPLEGDHSVSLTVVYGQNMTSFTRWFRYDDNTEVVIDINNEKVVGQNSELNKRNPHVAWHDTLRVRFQFNGKYLNLDAVGLHSLSFVKVSDDKHIGSPKILSLSDRLKTEYKCSFDVLDEVTLQNGTPFKVVLNYDNGKGDQAFFFKSRTRFDLYGPTGFGLWIPIGLFGSNLKQKDDTTGIEFAALPLNLALGVRYNWGKANAYYVGLSGFVSYQFHVVPDNASGNQSQYLTAFTCGILVDVDDLVYVGYATDFVSTNVRHTKGLYVLGVAPTLTQIISLLGQSKE